MTKTIPGGINAAMNATLSGMQRAVERLEMAAIRLANTTAAPGTPAYVSPPPREGIDSGIAANQGQEALETVIEDVMIAKRAYEANAKAFRFISATEDWLFNRGF
ncbi:MAG: hypothetical protein FJX33_01030 [Alphaproteobacteria bacterium]|nr:hypothetical protein [Alphaproteobacteria bacterium]